MTKLFGLVMGVNIIILLLLACTPQAAPGSLPTVETPQAATPIPAPVATVSAEEIAWKKIVDAAKKEAKLTIYSGNFTGDIGIALSGAFKEKYGIQVDIISGRGTEFIQRLQAEKRMGGIMADLEDTSGTNAQIMKQQNLTVGISKELPALRERDIWVADIFYLDPQDKHAIGFNFMTYTPFVNINLVKPGEEPKVWRDLLDPRWKGKMLAVNPTSSAGALNNFVPLMREKVIDEEFLKALYKQDLQFTISGPDNAARLSRGERPLIVSDNSTSFSKFISEGAPIKAVEISDGTVLTAIAVVAFDGAPHPNAAKVFINWLMSPEGQTTWGKANGAASVRKDVPNFLPQGSRVTPKRLILATNEDAAEAARLFQQQYLNKLWGR